MDRMLLGEIRQELIEVLVSSSMIDFLCAQLRVTPAMIKPNNAVTLRCEFKIEAHAIAGPSITT